MATMITDAILREAMALALAGGTKEHPYDQRMLGAPECGTPCCVMGLAFALAGDEVGWRCGWPDVSKDATPWRRTVQGVLSGTGDDCLQAALLVDAQGTLKGADLSGMSLDNANLSWVDLTDADLSGAHMSWVDLTDADLSRANLRGVNLTGGNLRGADLSGADLSGADLFGGNLVGATLTDANLSVVNLTDANLTDANLTDANLTGVIY